MSRECLKPESGDRIADIPHGKLEASLNRLAECNLNRAAIERINTDLPYAEAVVCYMRTGYDVLEADRVATEALRAKWKNLKQITVTHSVHSDEELRTLCARAMDNTDSFLGIAGLSFVRALLPPGREQDTLAKLRAILPSPPGSHSYPLMDAPTLASWGIIGAARTAIKYLENPRAPYFAPTVHHGLWKELIEDTRPWAGELGHYNPALLLEHLGIGVARLLAEGSPRHAVHLIEEVFRDAPLVTLDSEPQNTIGVQIAKNCHIALEWFVLRQRFPDPALYQHSLHVCCNEMHFKYLRPSQQDAIISGELAKGISIVWNLKERDSPRAYFRSCPYCKALLFIPEGAPAYEDLADETKSRLNTFIWAR